MSPAALLWLLGGLVLLVAGAELLVRGASQLARQAGISPLIIGLTVVAFGTSSPETAVSLHATLSGQPEVAVGNVVGSNIFNIILILGISATITPLIVSRQLIRLDVPIMIAASFLALLFGWNGSISRLEGILLFSGIILYLTFLIYQGRRETAENSSDQAENNDNPGKSHWSMSVLLVVGGLGILVVGSRWLVQGAVQLAVSMGVSDLIIGLTVVAAGTSLPEVATSVIASIRGERDIAVGNVVGSNIFNILAVMGLTAITAPQGLPVSEAALHFDMPVMIAVAVACLPVFFTGHLIARWEGILFLAYYFAYTIYLILSSMQHEFLPVFSSIMLEFVVPITVITLVTVLVRAIRAQRTSQ